MTKIPRDSSEPKLQAPGAGLPLPQRIFLRFYMGPFVAKKADWSKSHETFKSFHSKILKQIEGLSEQALSEKVLVPPQKGLEDSSRYWSIAMVLEHLTLVGKQISTVVECLSSGIEISETVDIAKVKPLGAQSVAQSLQEFKDFTENGLPKNVKDQNSRATLVHPWFGPFNARQWNWLLAGHSAIHYQQIKAIKNGLNSQ